MASGRVGQRPAPHFALCSLDDRRTRTCLDSVVAVFLGDTVARSLLEDILEIPAPPSIFQAKGSVLALASFWIFVPFAATCRFLLYINGRTRTEGWDVQTRFAAIAARALADEARDSISPGRAA